MDKLMNFVEIPSILLGRALLGIYFIMPGIDKIGRYDFMTQYMTDHGVPMIEVLLPFTIVLQIALGIFIIVGFQARVAAFVLAGLTLVISLYMHNFWNLPEGGNVQHETQNFFKNMGIMAGLLILSARGSGRFSIDNYLEARKVP